ncbi:MAG: hypothetical protein HC915_19460, partial [Anaerolineae bacterium]|nr:hypothetical protein [Anaerolineae bacterium]
MNLSLLALSYFFHLVATVVWLGGMALLVLIIYPLSQRHGQFAGLAAAIEARFRPFANLSLFVLLVTGVVQTGAAENYGGLLDFSTPWSQAIFLKHLAFIGMVVVVGWLQFGLAPTLDRLQLLALKNAEVENEQATARAQQRRLTQINFGAGGCWCCSLLRRQRPVRPS